MATPAAPAGTKRCPLEEPGTGMRPEAPKSPRLVKRVARSSRAGAALAAAGAAAPAHRRQARQQLAPGGFPVWDWSRWPIDDHELVDGGEFRLGEGGVERGLRGGAAKEGAMNAGFAAHVGDCQKFRAAAHCFRDGRNFSPFMRQI